MLVIPLNAVPSQTLDTVLNGQPVTINIYQKVNGLYCDLVCTTMVNGGLFGVICENLNRIVRDLYLGFLGDIAFFDTQGTSDPTFDGLGGRYQLAYLTPAELKGAG